MGDQFSAAAGQVSEDRKCLGAQGKVLGTAPQLFILEIKAKLGRLSVSYIVHALALALCARLASVPILYRKCTQRAPKLYACFIAVYGAECEDGRVNSRGAGLRMCRAVRTRSAVWLKPVRN